MAAAARQEAEADPRETFVRPPPHGRRITLKGRGQTFARILKGPPGARSVVLLHGWVASGGLNWFQAFRPLSRHFGVLAQDLRGHGRGIRSWRRFTLADCADDVAALLRTLNSGPAVVVGYSMGGPVSQLLWQRHPELVAGLVMVATSERPIRTDRAARVFGGLMGGAAVAGRLTEWSTWLPRAIAAGAGGSRRPRPRPATLGRWAAAEFRRHDPRHILEAGFELGRYDARSWVGDIDVPTAVVVTERDQAVPAQDQHALARRIRGATVHRVDDGHLACVKTSFGERIVNACRDVNDRAG